MARFALRRNARLAPFHGGTVERSITIAEALDAFCIDLALRRRSPRTIAPYRSYIKPLGLDRMLSDVLLTDLQRLVLNRLDRNPRTAYACHSALSSFFAYCAREGYSDNLMRRVPRPAPELPEHRYLSQQEIVRVYAACNTDDNRLVVRLLLCGLRARELLGLRFDDVQGEAAHVRLAKGGRPRRVWLDDETRRLLALRVDANPQAPVLGCTYASLRERVARIGDRAGIPQLTARWFRRTWASHAFLAGMNITTVQRLGGWSGLKMPMYYARSALDEAALNDAARFDLTGRMLGEHDD